VLAIERHILSSAPHLKDKNFKIEDKKIINAAGVHHEIDIFVTVDAAPGYSATYIFECKNWKDAVGKTEIVDFIEKIECTNAAHGYFVAKSFTKDASAQATKSTRLTLLIATENDPAGLPIPGDFHTTLTNHKRTEVNFFRRGRKPDAELVTIDIKTAKAELNGAPINLGNFVMLWSHEVASHDTLRFPSQRFPIGEYEREALDSKVFQSGEMMVNDMDIELGTVQVLYTVTICRPAVHWSFDIESRGRVLTFAPVTLPEGGEFISRLVMNIPETE
jgi:hypothetical protein